MDYSRQIQVLISKIWHILETSKESTYKGEILDGGKTIAE